MSITTEAFAVAAEQAAIERGWTEHRRAAVSPWPEDRASTRLIALTLIRLREALDLYAAISGDEIHPASEWPELADDPEAKSSALRMAAQDVADWADEMVRVLPAAGEGIES